MKALVAGVSGSDQLLDALLLGRLALPSPSPGPDPPTLRASADEIGAMHHHLHRLKDVADIHQVVGACTTSGLVPREAGPGWDYTSLLAGFRTNNFAICDDFLVVEGAGVYPLAALANHHCRPNSCKVFQGSRLLMRTVRPVAEGEELCHSYIDLAALHHDLRSRRAALLQRYFFLCQCSHCKQQEQQSAGGGPVAPDPEDLALASQLAAAAVHEDEPEQELKLRAMCWQIRRETLGPQHPDTLAAQDALSEVLIIVGDYEQAAANAVELAQARQVLRPLHPTHDSYS